MSLWRDQVLSEIEINCVPINSDGKPTFDRSRGAKPPVHRAVVLRSGGFRLCDHDEDVGLRNALVDEMRDHANLPPEHTCMATLRAWRRAWAANQALLDNGYKSTMSKVWEAYAYVRAVHGTHTGRGVDPLTVPLRERMIARATRTAHVCLMGTKYNEGFPGGAAFRVKEGRNVEGVALRVPDERSASKNGVFQSEHLRLEVEVALDPLRWFHRVFRAGVAVVEGYFVVDVLATYLDGSLVVAAIRPNPGTLGLILSDALVYPQTKRIEWLPSRYHEGWLNGNSRSEGPSSLVGVDHRAHTRLKSFGSNWQQALDKLHGRV
jgi:hypothetical protein